MGYNYLFMFSTVIMVLSLIGLFVFALIRRSNNPTAKTLAVLGVGVLLLIQIIPFLRSYVMTRVANPNQMALYHGAFSLISSVFYAGGIGVLVVAAFHGRGSAEAMPATLSETLAPVPPDQDNPFSPTH